MFPVRLRPLLLGALALLMTGAAAASGVTPAQAAGGTVAPSLLIDSDFPDPDLAQDGSTWHAWSTSAGGKGTVPHATAPSPTGPWTVTGDSLDHKPAWARADHGFWAPEVTKLADGSWLMYFTARHDANGRMCLGAARSADPAGPFVPTSESSPLVCDATEGGAIDPSSFVDSDGTRYLLYKNDGNAVGKPAILWLQQVDAGGTTLVGARTELLRNSDASDQGVIEAPTLVKRPSQYVLFFSAGVYSQGTYHTSYATSPTLKGTYSRAFRPLITTDSVDGAVNGPGGQDVHGDRIFFHGHLAAGGRGMYTAELGWPGDRPVVRGSRVRYEAESAPRNDCTTRSASGTSQGSVVAKIDTASSWFEPTVHVPTSGSYTVHVRYAAGYGAAQHALSVNGASPITVDYPDRGWDNWSEVPVDVDLQAGANTLRFTHQSKFAEVDYVEVA